MFDRATIDLTLDAREPAARGLKRGVPERSYRLAASPRSTSRAGRRRGGATGRGRPSTDRNACRRAASPFPSISVTGDRSRPRAGNAAGNSSRSGKPGRWAFAGSTPRHGRKAIRRRRTRSAPARGRGSAERCRPRPARRRGALRVRRQARESSRRRGADALRRAKERPREKALRGARRDD